ncbi:MAG: FkbM family methyltransferase [Thermoflexales bacterium]|nr:FkbM family methyltransferase [Thermoflexales bacterium]
MDPDTNDIEYCSLEIRHARFEIAVGKKYEDPISDEIANQTFSFPTPLDLAFDLLQPGSTVLDLGAHIGTFSLAAAALGYRVASVEASPYNVDLLKTSVARNKFDQVHVIAAAVSDQPGSLEFVSLGPYGFVSSPTMKGESTQVPALTVDDLLARLGWDRVDLIKMDIEGSEVAAIRGMSGLLSRDDAPPVVYESNGHTLRLFGETPNRLMAAFERFGYRNYLVGPGRLTPVQSDHMQPECNVDYLAIKQLPEGMKNWQIVLPMTTEQMIARILSACAHSNNFCRLYTARALAGATRDYLLDLRVVNALESLCMDPNAEVRAAMAWFDPYTMKLAAQVCARTEAIKSKADVMARGYAVRSRIPLIGGLVAWVRRNMTSHLREPYLDPTLERQVAFNRLLMQEVCDLAELQSHLMQQIAHLQAQLSDTNGYKHYEPANTQ